MNETLKSIFARNSCRDFSGSPLSDEQVKIIAEAALAAPSAMNLQPWHIIVVTDKSLIDEMDEEGMRVLAEDEDKSSYERVKSRGGKLFYNAPCMVMIASNGSGPAALDCGIVSQNVALAAHSLGLGNVICGMAAIPFSGTRGKEFMRRMKFPDGYGFGMSVLIGAASSGKEPHEMDFGKVTYIK